jgi:acetyltransferase-like isoleucine patch superfamily enzyme
MRATIDHLISKIYWSIQNRVRSTFVAGGSVSRNASVGKYCWIGQGAEVHGNVTLGEYSYIVGPNTFVDEAIIGKFCSIARNAIIGPPGHDYRWVSTHKFISSKSHKFMSDDRPWPQKDAPIIGHDVWIGMNSVILRGVKIGHGAVIAAGAVVTHDVHPYSIVAGVPARHIKYRFPEHARRALLEMKWWDWDEDQLREALPCFYDMDAFLARYGPNAQTSLVDAGRSTARAGKHEDAPKMVLTRSH